MEAIVSEPTQGQDSKTATEAVAEVFPSSKFLQDVSLETSAPKKSAPSALCARVQELEEEVQAERQESAALRSQIEYQQNQLESLTSKIEKTKTTNQKQHQELDNLKQGEETNSLCHLLSVNKE
ncbi:unnamed protein product [Urochloa decumbens]|uniref:Uncharacterized protein n=1 Tax=Urochloa decumbens TaxID=240449 RepID=A0ABC9AQX8_9POAL